MALGTEHTDRWSLDCPKGREMGQWVRQAQKGGGAPFIETETKREGEGTKHVPPVPHRLVGVRTAGSHETRSSVFGESMATSIFLRGHKVRTTREEKTSGEK